MNHGDAFAGIGGFGEAARRVGWSTVWACEIEPSARSVYSARLGHDGLRFDIDIRESRDIPSIDILTGGFPCQDISVAGKRRGLAGARSGLFFELVRILESARPTWFCFENVDALLSSNSGRDMGVVLSTLVECGYSLAWRVFDSRFFGLAQRRRRIFLVGHSSNERYPAQVLFESARGNRNPSSRRKAWGEDSGTDFIGAQKSESEERWNDAEGDRIVPTLMHNFQGLPHYVSHALTSEGADASEDGSGRGAGIVISNTLRGNPRSSNSNGNSEAATLISATLGTNDDRLDRGRTGPESVYIHPTLTSDKRLRGGSNGNTEAKQLLVHSTVTATNARYGSGGNNGAPPPLVTGISQNQRGEVRTSRVASALVSSGGGKPGQGYQLAAFDSDGMGEIARIPGALDVCAICENGPDAPRYRGLGNAVSVPVVEWIFRRINEVSG